MFAPTTTTHKLLYLAQLSLLVIVLGLPGGHSINELGGIYFPGNPPLDIICSEGPEESLLVVTGENYYGIISPKLSALKWKAVAVNGNQVFVNTLHNKTFTTNLNGLTDHQRNLLQKIRSERLLNLNGLGLTRDLHNTGSSAAVGNYFRGSRADGYATSGAANSYSGQQQYAPSNNYQSQAAYQAVPATSGPAPVAYNYYNLNAKTCSLRNMLRGEVYSFSLRGHILDIFSSSVMVHQKGSETIVYRDHKYFSYARQSMPADINRFFVSQDTVIFVYNDGTIMAKLSLKLDPIELELVLGARQTIRELGRGLAAAADIASHSFSGPASSQSISTAVESPIPAAAAASVVEVEADLDPDTDTDTVSVRESELEQAPELEKLAAAQLDQADELQPELLSQLVERKTDQIVDLQTKM